MTDSIKLPVEIEYHFRWENPYFKQKVEVFSCSEHVATVDKAGTLSLKKLPCSREVSHAARVWAGWKKPSPDVRAPTTDSRPPTSDVQSPTDRRKLVLLNEEQSRTIKELLWVAEGESAVDAEKVRELSVAINMLTDYQPPTANDQPQTTDSQPPTAENRLPTENRQDEVKLVERYQQCVSKLLTLFPFDPLGESTAHFYIERLEALIDRKLLIANLPLNPTSTPITREQASAIRQLIRASYFNVPGLHVHVLLEVFDRLILEANCEFDECTYERNATAHSQDYPIVRRHCLMVQEGTLFPPANWPGWARTPESSESGRSPKPEPPLDDRCTNCKEFDLDGCASCGPITHAKVYGVDDSEVSHQSRQASEPKRNFAGLKR